MLITCSIVSALLAQAEPAGAAAPPPAVALRERRDAAGLAEAVAALKATWPDRVEARILATSVGSHPIHLLTIADDPQVRMEQPAILVVGGMDGHRWSSTEAALAITEAVLRDRPEALRGITLHVVPCANPDAAERFARGPRRASASNAVAHDNDKDGYGEEDQPRDLNGDGLITQMRKAGSQPPWCKPTLVADPAEPRLMKAPDAAAGQLPEWTVWTEGIDADADGRMAEDWAGGIDPERNFPHRWPEFEDEAGVYPLIATESKAIADFVIANPQVFAALVVGRHDTVVNVPDAKSRTPGGMPSVLDEGDAAAYGELAKAFREITGQSRADGADTAGSLVAWLNAQRGVPAFATTLWGRPDAPPAPEGTPAKDPKAPKPSDEAAAAWLEYSDRARGGTGFVPWTRQQHPQLGEVEVGGWVPGFRENPPLAEVGPASAKLVAFLGRVAEARPKVMLAAPTIERAGPSLWRIDAALTNTGRLPSVMRGGRAEGVTPAHVVRISVPADRVKSGRRVDIVRGIDPGATRPCSWIVNAPDDETIVVELLYAGKPVARHAFRGGVAVPAEGAR
jgi:hypothetical protein